MITSDEAQGQAGDDIKEFTAFRLVGRHGIVGHVTGQPAFTHWYVIDREGIKRASGTTKAFGTAIRDCRIAIRDQVRGIES